MQQPKITVCKPSKRGKPKQFVKAKVKVSLKQVYYEASCALPPEGKQ